MMDGFVSALKRFSFSTSYTKWTSSFSKLVQQVSSKSSVQSISDKISLLRKLEPYLKEPGFVNTEDVEILQAKEDLLILWQYLLDFVVLTSKPTTKEIGYTLIVQLMQRSEFTLRRLGFDSKSQSPRCSRSHLRLAESYKKLLLETYILVMKSMGTKGKFAEIIHFSAQTLSIFFFRLPLVGGRIIDALQRKSDNNKNATGHELMDIELRLIKVLAVTEMEDSDFIAYNPDLFQWNYFDSESEAELLQPSLSAEDNACLVWLSTKETFFLTFVEVFVMHVETVSGMEVRWNVIPAYELLLDCFWPLLRSSIWWDGISRRRTGEGDGWVTSLPAYMRVKRSALALLSNKQLINAFIRLTFECTNVHSLLSVDSCVEHLNLWFSTVAYSSSAKEGIFNHNQSNKVTASMDSCCLPTQFDYDNYWFGISALLQSELFQVLLKVCSLLYNTFHLFDGQMRIKLVGDLMSHYFFRLFLHWSTEVRTYFQLTLVYKVLRSDRRFLPCFTDAQVIHEYGNIQGQVSSKPISQRRTSFDGKIPTNSRQEEFNVPANVYSGESSFERRMAVFDNSNSSEHLLIDIMHCSKIDSYVRMCLDKDPAIPSESLVYVEASLKQYAHLLKQYYRGAVSDSSESLPLLAHRMVYSDSNPYVNNS